MRTRRADLLAGAVGAAVVLTAAAVLVRVAVDPDDLLPTAVVLLALAECFAIGRWTTGLVPSLAGATLLIGALVVAARVTHDAAVPMVLIPGAAWAAGWAIRERDVVVRRLDERARELEEEREAHAELSVRYERARIASELHDIVAHAISVMVVQAAAGQRLVAVDEELTAEAFAAIAGAARQAEEDMGRLVALLSDEDAIAPAPDLDLVGELVARAAGAGLDVTLRLEGDREGFPPAVAQAAYRLVQESLTNAMRYAAGAAVEVLMRGDARDLHVWVRNAPGGRPAELTGQGTGNGLRGVRERVDACQGRVEWGPTGRGGWSVAAWLPRRLSAPAASAPPPARGAS